GGVELPNVVVLPENAPEGAAKKSAKGSVAKSRTTITTLKRPFRKTTVAKTAIFGNLRNTTKLTSNQFSPEVIDDFLHGGVIIKQEPEMNVDLLAGFKDPNGKIYDANALAKMKKDIEDVWDNSLGLQ